MDTLRTAPTRGDVTRDAHGHARASMRSGPRNQSKFGPVAAVAFALSQSGSILKTSACTCIQEHMIPHKLQQNVDGCHFHSASTLAQSTRLHTPHPQAALHLPVSPVAGVVGRREVPWRPRPHSLRLASWRPAGTFSPPWSWPPPCVALQQGGFVVHWQKAIGQPPNRPFHHPMCSAVPLSATRQWCMWACMHSWTWHSICVHAWGGSNLGLRLKRF